MKPGFPSDGRSTRRGVVGVSLVVLGGALLVVSVLGDAGYLGDLATEPPRAWEEFDPGLAADARSLADLRRIALEDPALAGGATEVPTVEALHRVVARRFTHGSARHTPGTNWILWALGTLHPGFGHVYDPAILVSRGNSLLCDQAAAVLGALADESGFPVRIVALDGHVVVEIWADGDWRYLDPDLEVTGQVPEDGFLDLARLSRRPGVVRSLYADERSGTVAVILSREDNYAVPYPARVDWKSSLLAQNERVAEILKYVIPLALLVVGWRVRRFSSEAAPSSDALRGG